MSLTRTKSIFLSLLLLAVSDELAAGISSVAAGNEDRTALTDQDSLPLAEDLLDEARMAACKGQPLVLMFGSSSCPYCKVVRSLYLSPLQQDHRYPGIVIRELETDSSARVRDFSGKMTTMEQLASSYQVTLVPAVMVFVPGGTQVGKTLLGLTTEDFYAAYLDQAILSGVESVSAMPSGEPSGVPGAYACD